MAVMKKIVLALTPFVLMGSVAIAQADSAAPATSTQPSVTIGVIDLAAVLQQSPAAKAAGDQLKKQFKPRQDKIIAAQQQLQSDQEKYKRDSTVMSQSDVQALQEKISREQRTLQQTQEDYMQDLRTAQSQAMQKVLQQIDQAVQKIATANHYDLILQKNSIAYSSQRIDITNQVIDAIKK